jgi:hypothetical protein
VLSQPAAGARSDGSGPGVADTTAADAGPPFPSGDRYDANGLAYVTVRCRLHQATVAASIAPACEVAAGEAAAAAAAPLRANPATLVGNQRPHTTTGPESGCGGSALGCLGAPAVSAPAVGVSACGSDGRGICSSYVVRSGGGAQNGTAALGCMVGGVAAALEGHGAASKRPGVGCSSVAGAWALSADSVLIRSGARCGKLRELLGQVLSFLTNGNRPQGFGRTATWCLWAGCLNVLYRVQMELLLKDCRLSIDMFRPNVRGTHGAEELTGRINNRVVSVIKCTKQLGGESSYNIVWDLEVFEQCFE